jgi:PKD repeat protein
MADPTVTAITPATGYNDRSYSITDLAGTGFGVGAVVEFRKSGIPKITATDVEVVSETKITCKVDLDGVSVGAWDVQVIMGETDGGLVAGFAVSVPPTVSFTAIPRATTSGGSVRFYPLISGNVHKVVSYDWDFGDETDHGTVATPIHVYPTVSTYTTYNVTLTITESNSEETEGTISDFIAVDDADNVPAVPTDGTYQAISVLLWNDTNQMLVNRNPWAGSSYYLLKPEIKNSIDKIGTMTFTLLDVGNSTAAEKTTVSEGNYVLAIMGQTAIFSGVVRRVTQNNQTAFTNTTTKMQMWDVECDSDLGSLKNLKVSQTALDLTQYGETIFDSPGDIAQRILL